MNIETAKTNGKVRFLHRCETLRQQAGLSIAKLAQKADVDRGTVAKIEKHQGVMGDKVGSVFNALNEAHKGTLAFDVEVTESPTIKKTRKR
jgi:DNA-binding XRE family transcriptional regulator